MLANGRVSTSTGSYLLMGGYVSSAPEHVTAKREIRTQDAEGERRVLVRVV
jgi:hypothetical protein